MNRCANCGREITEDICPACGTSNKIESCPVCGQHRIKGAPYCGNCGFAFWLSDKRSHKVGSKISRFILPAIAIVAFASLMLLIFTTFLQVSSGNKIIASIRGYDILFGNTANIELALSNVSNISTRLIVYTIMGWVAVAFAVLLVIFFIDALGKYTKTSLVIMLVLTILIAIIITAGYIDYLVIKNTVYRDYTVSSHLLVSVIVSVLAVLMAIASITMFNPTLRNKSTVVSKEVKAKPVRNAINFSSYVYDHKVGAILISVGTLLVVGFFITMFVMIANAPATASEDWKNVKKIALGQSKTEVIELLGTPKNSQDDYYEYYSENYTEKCVPPTADKDYWHLANESDADNLHYECVRIGFNSNGQVVSVVYDKDHKYTKEGFTSWTTKSTNDFNMLNPIVDNLGFLIEDTTEFSINYTDGSYLKGIITNIKYSSNPTLEIDGRIQYSFDTIFGQVTSSITGCKIAVSNNKLIKVDPSVTGEVFLPSFITKIGAYAFNNVNGITKLYIHKEVVELEAYFLGNCTSLQGMEFELVSDWYYSDTSFGEQSYAIGEESLSQSLALTTILGYNDKFVFRIS